MDPRKAAAEWFHTTVFKDEAIRPRPRPARTPERVPAPIVAARSLENGPYQRWQSREAVFMKQGKLLANYEDDFEFRDEVLCYYPTYQALTNRQLRGYFSWRTRLRRGEVGQAPLSFAFLYIYELINQIGVSDPLDGYRRLENFRDAYGQTDTRILSYLKRWMVDYAVYYGLDPALFAGTPQAVFDRNVAVLEQIQEREPVEIMDAVRQLSPQWLNRSKFYAAFREDMDTVTVRVLRRISEHCAARCKRSMTEQYFGSFGEYRFLLFDSAVFCDPLKRKNYEYALDGQCIYSCKNGFWSVRKRYAPSGSGKMLDELLKTIDSVMREEFRFRYPVKPGLDTKWVLRIVRKEVEQLFAEKEAAREREANKVAIDYAQLARIRRDAAATQEKLIVEDELDFSQEEPARAVTEAEAAKSAESAENAKKTAPEEGAAAKSAASASEETPLSFPEYRLLQCLLYGGDLRWVREEGRLLSVLVDGINEKLYDTFLDCVVDCGEHSENPRLAEDYIEDLKEMVRP